MNRRRVLKLVAGWALAWVLFAGVMGIVLGLSPSGGFLAALTFLLVYGVLPGLVGGLLFAMAYLPIAGRTSGTWLRVLVGTATGIASGIAIVFPFAWTILSHESLGPSSWICGAQGGLTGLVCALVPIADPAGREPLSGSPCQPADGPSGSPTGVEDVVDRSEQAPAPNRAETKSTSTLEQEVFHYASDYFDFIGHDHPCVIAFKSLLARRDVRGLCGQWASLSDAFVRLEAAAGRRGRPYLMDYYFSYDEALIELAKRLGR